MASSVVLSLLLLLCVCGGVSAAAASPRYALFWLTGSTYLNSSADYEKGFHQWAAQNRSGYIMAGSAYQLGDDGSLQYFAGGDKVEKYGFSTLAKMGLQTQAMFYTLSYAGLAKIIADPKPIVQTLVQRALQYNIGGINLDYEPGQPIQRHRRRRYLPPELAAGYGDFMVQLGAALAVHNLTLTVDIGGCPDWVDLTCQQLASMPNFLGAQTMDSFSASDVPSFQTYEAQDRVGQLGAAYWPGFEPGGFNSSNWLQLNQYLAKQQYTGMSTWSCNDVSQGDQPQWLFDGVNAFLDGN